MQKQVNQALRLSQQLATGTLTPAEFTLRLADLGFYEVEVSPPAAMLNGVRFPLSPYVTELS